MAKSQTAGRCIFCNGFNLTKEHIWSDWLTQRGVISPEHARVQNAMRVRAAGQGGPASIQPEPPRARQGSLVQMKIRKVCNTCNSGWMGGVVEKAIPHAEPLIRGQDSALDDGAQSALSAWISLTCIMAEFTDEQSKVIPQEDRMYMRDHRRPSDHWRIYVARYEGKEWFPARYNHHGATFGAKPRPPASEEIEMHYYQTTTYALGGLVIYAISASHLPILESAEAMLDSGTMSRIWPISEPFEGEGAPILRDPQLALIADHVTRELMGNIGSR